MGFSLVKRRGMPDELMEVFYRRGKDAGDFGTTQDRAESGKYDTIALVTEDKVAGTADLVSTGTEAILRGCYILPEYRGKLETNGKSAFEHLVSARLNRTELPVRTSATTDHGATQHIYNKFEFAPYEFELPSNPDERPHITMAKPHHKRRFDRELYAPEAVGEFIDCVASGFGQEAELSEGEYTGVEVSYIEDVSDEDYGFFKVSEGEQGLQSAVKDILDKKQGSANGTVQIDSEVPSSYDVICELLEKDFRPSGYEPVVEGSQMSQTSIIHMSYSSEPIRTELIPEIKDFLEAGGWGLQMIEPGDRASEFKIY